MLAEALWSLDRPGRSRQRNMRSCRNALDAALSDRGDAHDLVDAHEYAEKVIEDPVDGMDYFQALVRAVPACSPFRKDACTPKEVRWPASS